LRKTSIGKNGRASKDTGKKLSVLKKKGREKEGDVDGRPEQRKKSHYQPSVKCC